MQCESYTVRKRERERERERERREILAQGALFFAIPRACGEWRCDYSLRVGDGVARTLVSSRPRHKWR